MPKTSTGRSAKPRILWSEITPAKLAAGIATALAVGVGAVAVPSHALVILILPLFALSLPVISFLLFKQRRRDALTYGLAILTPALLLGGVWLYKGEDNTDTSMRDTCQHIISAYASYGSVVASKTLAQGFDPNTATYSGEAWHSLLGELAEVESIAVETNNLDLIADIRRWRIGWAAVDGRTVIAKSPAEDATYFVDGYISMIDAQHICEEQGYSPIVDQRDGHYACTNVAGLATELESGGALNDSGPAANIVSSVMQSGSKDWEVRRKAAYFAILITDGFMNSDRSFRSPANTVYDSLRDECAKYDVVLPEPK